jgi:hypothetical protein
MAQNLQVAKATNLEDAPMKLGPGICAFLLIAGVGASSVFAQAIPQGSYLQSCSGARIDGDSLTALCKQDGGPERQSALLSYARCIGDIVNVDGVLQCDFGAVAPAPALVLAQARYCGDLHHAVQGLAERLDRTKDPAEHARLESRLFEARYQEADCVP